MSYVIAYPPCSYEAKIMKVTAEIYSQVSKICNGYEAVRIPRLSQIKKDAVFICCDDFNRLDPKDQYENYVGTYLYVCDWKILGTICIVKERYDEDGITNIGFTKQEANYICNQVKNRIHISSNYSYR